MLLEEELIWTAKNDKGVEPYAAFETGSIRDIGQLYGEVMVELLDYTVSDNDIRCLDKNMLCKYLMYTDRDRASLEIAEELYWKIVREIATRIENGRITE